MKSRHNNLMKLHQSNLSKSSTRTPGGTTLCWSPLPQLYP